MAQRYTTELEDRDGLEVYSLRQDGRARADVAPGLGNNCFLFECDGLPVLQPVPFEEFLERPTGFGIPILFPFVNRIRDGAFDFGGRHFKVDPPRHGFVRDKSWKVTERGASDQFGAWITSTFDAQDFPDQILKQFPFPFQLEVTYRLLDGRLQMQTLARNTGSEEMPLSFGIHPYFRLPEQGTVMVPAGQRWELQESLTTGRLLPVEGVFDLRQPRPLAGLQLDDIFTGMICAGDQPCRCILHDHVNSIDTVVEFDARDFPHVVVYTPPAPRRAICIEPNSSPTDAFNLASRGHEHADVVRLTPQTSQRWVISIYTRTPASR